MLSVAIIEDDPLTTQLLISTLKEINHQVTIAATLSSVQESVSFFKINPAIDLILSDVQLTDG
jgi:CheY-like chemotaxis protein